MDFKRAQKAKELGNQAFKKGNCALAIKFFTEAIKHQPDEKTFYSNRSAAYCALGKNDKLMYDISIDDAKKAISLDPEQAKGYARHAKALFMKGDYKAAVQIYAIGISKDPSNSNLTQGLQAAQAKINSSEQKNVKKELYAVGIDLGTTFSCVAVQKEDGVEIIPNSLGDRTTPSYVSQTKTGERLIGHPAKNMASSNPNNTIYDIKRIIGQRFDDPGVERDTRVFSFEVTRGCDDRPLVQVEIDGKSKEFAPEEISAMVLSNLKQTAEDYLGGPVTKAVITVPAYFNDSQRSATKSAGAIAGLEILRIINEPTAAALAYGLDGNMDKPINVLLFDLGGGTFDVSVLHIADGLFEVKATGGDTRLGGEDFDNSVVEFLVKESLKQNFTDISQNKRAMRRLQFAAEHAKRTLSSSRVADIDIESLTNGKDFIFQLTRAKFEALNKTAFLRCLETVQRVLKDSKLKADDISEVVLVGGSTRIPKLQQMLQEFFNGKELCKSLNPDEAVAYGAAVQAGVLTGKKSDLTKDILLMDVTPLSLGIELVGRVMSVIIPRNAHVPCIRKQIYTTEEDYQTEVDICVFEGERLKTVDNNLLGKFTISGVERAKKGEPQIEVCFELDGDGILRVTATDQNSGAKADITVQNRQNATPGDVARMIKEADFFKERDKEHFAKIEASNKLQAVIFKVQEISKTSKISQKLQETLQKSANDVQEWLDDHSDIATSKEIETHLRNLERRIQAHSMS